MLRQILIPADNRLLLELPDDYVNQKIEIIAFRIDDGIKKKPTRSDPLAIFEQYQGLFDLMEINHYGLKVHSLGCD